MASTLLVLSACATPSGRLNLVSRDVALALAPLVHARCPPPDGASMAVALRLDNALGGGLNARPVGAVPPGLETYATCAAAAVETSLLWVEEPAMFFPAVDLVPKTAECGDGPMPLTRVQTGVDAPTGIGGSMSRHDILRGINGAVGRVDACAPARWAELPVAGPKVVIDFMIGPSGHVVGSCMRDASALPEVDKCIDDVVRTLRFVKPTGGSITVTFPFQFLSRAE